MAITCRTAFSISIFLLVSFIFTAGIAKAEKRVALVIGNSAYTTVPALVTPQNDALAIGEALSRLGFEVITGLDLDERQMLRTFNNFSKKVARADVALLYYAGHGLQVSGTNYLVPTDASLESEFDLQAQAMRLNLILNMMRHPSRTSIVLLDACRDNPMAKRLTRSMGTRSNDVKRGFARVSTGVGTYIGFSTEPGNVALDGDGEHSPFARALLNNISRENLDIESIMRLVRSEVYKETHGNQTPWGNSSLVGKGFIFNKSTVESGKTTNLDRKIAPISTKTNHVAEIAYWNTIKNETSKDFFESYISQYPNGLFVSIANLKISKINTRNKATERKINLANLDNNKSSSANILKNDAKSNVEKDKNFTEIIHSIQSELNRLGCNAGKPDGQWGEKSRKALGLYKRHSKLQLANLEPTFGLLGKLQKHNARICPLICQNGYKIEGDQCVRKPDTPKNTIINHFVDGAHNSIWVGKASYENGITYNIRLSKSGSKINVDYPGYNCGSKYVVTKHSGRKSVFKEVNNSGVDADCTDSELVTLTTKNENTIHYITNGNPSEGILKKEN